MNFKFWMEFYYNKMLLNFRYNDLYYIMSDSRIDGAHDTVKNRKWNMNS